jgi:hypothetical protein
VVQMVRLAPNGTVPTIRLQERSWAMMDAATPASKLAPSGNAGGRNQAGCEMRRPHRQRCGLFHALCSGGSQRSCNNDETARLKQSQQSAASGG